MQIHQVKVEQGGKSALLDLNPFFYPEKAVQKTASAFKEVCRAKFQTKNNRLIVELSTLGQEDLKELAKKFLNYALFVSKGMH